MAVHDARGPFCEGHWRIREYEEQQKKKEEEEETNKTAKEADDTIEKKASDGAANFESESEQSAEKQLDLRLAWRRLS